MSSGITKLTRTNQKDSSRKKKVFVDVDFRGDVDANESKRTRQKLLICLNGSV